MPSKVLIRGIGFLAVTLAVFLTGCGSGETRDTHSPLRVGTTGTDPPFSQLANGTYFGIDIDLARDLGRTLGRPVLFVPTTWSTLLPDLLEGRFDIAMSGIHATDERRGAARLSRAYIRSGKRAVVRCSDVGRFVTLRDVNRLGVRVLVNEGGTTDSFARDQLPNAIGVRNPPGSDLFEKLAAGEGDIVFTDAPEAAFQTNRHTTLCIGLNGALFGNYEVVIVMPRESELASTIDRWLAERMSEGYIPRLVEAHAGASRNVSPEGR